MKRKYAFEIINHPTYPVILGLDLLTEFKMRMPSLGFQAHEGNLAKTREVELELKSSNNLKNEFGLTEAELKIRQPYVDQLKEYLRLHSLIVLPDAHCTAEGAVIRVEHAPNTPPAWINQYGQSAIIKEMTMKHFKKWIELGYAIPYDAIIHGRQKYNNPIYAVRQNDANGNLVDVRLCMDMKQTNKGLINKCNFR